MRLLSLRDRHEDWIDSYRWPIDWPLNFLSDLARHGSRGSVCTADREGYTVHDRFTRTAVITA